MNEVLEQEFFAPSSTDLVESIIGQYRTERDKIELENGLVVHVGTGFTLEQRKDPQQFMRRYVEISYMELTDDGNLRHPSFKCFRDLDEHKGVKL